MADDRIEVDISGDTSEFDSAIEKLSSEVSAESGKLSDALKSVNTTIAETHDKLADVADQLNMNPGNTELLVQKQALLTQAVSATSEKLEMLKRAAEQAQTQLEQGKISQVQFDALQQEIAATAQSLASYQAQLGKTGTASENLQSELDEQKNKLDELKKKYVDAVLQYGKNSDEAQNLAGEIKSLSSEYTTNRKKMQDAVDAAEELTEENDDLSDSTEDVADNENELSKENADLSNSLEKVEKSTNQAETGADKFSSAIEKTQKKVSAATIAIGNVLADLGKKAVSSLWDVAKSSIETGKAFESSMSNVTALQQAAGASAEDIASLKKVAEDYGASTQFTMAQYADALGYMALAGWNAEQSAAALPGVLSLAAASGMELAKASDMVTDYMSTFSNSVSDYTGKALTATEFSDKLAYAQANANTNVEQLGEAFKNCGANMNAAGQQLDTATAMVMGLSDSLKGSEAGTGLAAMMRDITNSMQDGAIAIGNTTVAVTDSEGNYRDMLDVLADIEAATTGMGNAEKATALSTAFTADSTKSLNILLNTGTSKLREYEAGLSDCAGTADEAAKTLNDNLAGDMTYMESAMDAVKNTIYEGIEPALRSLVQSVTSDVAPQLQELVKGLFGVANGTADAGEQMQSAVSALAEWAINLVSDCLPKILTALTDVLGQLVLAIVNNAPALFNALLDSLFGMADALTVIAPQLLTSLVGLFFQIRTKIVASIPKLVQTATEFFSGILDALLSLDLAGEFAKLLDLLVRRLIYSVPKLAEAAENFFHQIIDEIPNFIDGAEQITDGILDAIETIIPKLLPVAKNLLETLVSGLKTALPQLGEFAQELIQKISDFIQENLSDLIEVAVQIITTLCETLLTEENLTMLLDIAVQILSAIVTALTDNLGLLISAAVQLITFLCENLLTQENITLLVDVAIQIIKALCENLLTGENLEMLLQAAVDLVNALVNAIVDNLDDLLLAAEEIIRKLCDELKNPEKIKEIVALGTELLAKLIVGICQIGGQLAGFALSLHEEIQSVCESIDWAEIGKEILEGILSGLLGVDFDLGSFFGEFGDNFVTGIKEIFGIHSPSKRMRDEIGKFLLPGIAVGVEDSVDSTQQDINHALDTMLNSVETDSLQLKFEDPEMPKITPELQELQLKLENPEILENFNAILSQIDFSRLQTQFDSAMQSLGISAIAQPTQNYNYYNNYSENPVNQTERTPESSYGDIIIPVSIGGQQLETFVIRAAQIANARSGGRSI